MNYFFVQFKDSYAYTVDMFRIYTRITSVERKALIKFLTGYNLTYWNMSRKDKFTDNFKADALWIGIKDSLKQEFDEYFDVSKTFMFCLEFNPNKMSERDIELYNIFINNYNWIVKRFDVAVDIPHNINNIVIFDIFKRNYSLFYNGYDNKTYYIGTGNGHIKIYNKKIEAGLTYELTRFEMTVEVRIPLDSFEFFDIPIKFPFVAFQPYISISNKFFDGDTSTLSAVIYAVNNGYPYKNLSRRYKDYIKKDLVGLTDMDSNFAVQVLQNFVKKVRAGISNKPANL